MGSAIALVVFLLASLAFGFYVANFGSYNKTYGAIGGVIIALLWLWILNMSLLFGAEFDAETERGRQLQAGIEAEETIQLPPRDTKKSDKLQAKEEEDIRRDGTAGGTCAVKTTPPVRPGGRSPRAALRLPPELSTRATLIR